jgi:hypothetical protein
MTRKLTRITFAVVVAVAWYLATPRTAGQAGPPLDLVHRFDGKACRPFSLAHSYLNGTYPGYIAAGDFNGDGILDIVTDEWYTGKLDVLLGKKDGTFQQAGSYSTGAKFPRKVVVGDFNNDGKLDVAVADENEPGGIDVLLGNGDGTFQAPIITQINYGPSVLAVADFNDDGKLDLVATGYGYTTILVFLGNGDGTFQSPASYPVGNDPSSIAIADFNGDGYLDLAVANAGWSCSSGDTVSVLFGNGDGTFQTKVDYVVGCQPFGVAAADLNGDGKVDLATANYVDGTVSVLLNKGNGTFRKAQTYPAGHPYAPGGIATVLFENDRLPSLAVATIAGTYILLNKGDGTFRTTGGYEPPYGDLVVADFNRDGKPDLALVDTSYEGTGGVAILYGTKHGFSGSHAYVAAPDVVSVRVGDFNRDGIPDLLVSGGSVGILWGLGKGHFSSQTEYFGMLDPGAIAIGDLNGDGNLDFVVASPSQVQVMLGNGHGGFTQGTTMNVAGTSQIALRELNGDGILDLVAMISADLSGGQNAVDIFLGRGDGTFGRGRRYRLPSYPNYAVGLVVADFNRDGKLDVAVANSNVGASKSIIDVFLGKGDGTFKRAKKSPAETGTFDLAVGEFNGDGKLDLATLVYETATDKVKILLGRGDGTFRPGASITDVDASGIGAADFNGDGSTDLAVPSRDGGVVTVFLNKGNGTFRPGLSSYIGENSYEPAVADLDGDGTPDLVIPNVDGGEVSVLLNHCSHH